MEEWRQGDFALGVGPFIARDIRQSDDPEEFEPLEWADAEDGVIGLVAISQTCDMVRENGGRRFITVCPLVTTSSEMVAEAQKGARPYLAVIENAPPGSLADLSRAMSVTKDLVRCWTRQPGFENQEGRKRFAAALARKYGNFAFPDEFDRAVANFAKRAKSVHERSASPNQWIYRTIRQVRYECEQDWKAAQKSIRMLVVLEAVDLSEEDYGKIEEEIRTQCDAVDWPDGYEWNDPPYRIGKASEYTGADYEMSEPADFEYLCL